MVDNDSIYIEQAVLRYFQSWRLKKYVWFNKVTFTTRINIDMHIYGNDWDAVLEYFMVSYDVNFEGFVFKTYFFDELTLPEFWWSLLSGKFKNKKPLTIAHLIEVVKRKQWVDPE